MNKFLKKLNSQRGITVVELLLYMGMLSVLLSILTSIFTSALNVQTESQATSSVVGDGNYILTKLKQDIHGAQSITVPSAPGEETINDLQIIVDGISYSYSVDANENLTLTDNLGTNNLNNYGTKISDFSVRRLGNVGGVEDTLRINFTVTGRVQKNSGLEIKSFQTNISLRRK